MNQNRRYELVVRGGLIALLLSMALTANAGEAATPAVYRELMQESLDKKFGLEFFVKGQVIPGVVTRLGNDGVVEVRNQSRDRVIIRLDRIDAIAR
jgi:hypothetical protein